MFKAYGLYSHIRANRWRTVLLLAGFVLLLHILVYSGFIIVEAFGGGAFEDIFARAGERFVRTWPLSLILALGWFVIAYFFHQRLINAAVGAVGVSRAEQPRLYDALETLCISRGITMPTLQIIESPALNAFASGISDDSYTVTVTRGLLEALEPDELEAVLAHELTHIRNNDTRLMVVAAIFAGIFAFIGDMFIRRWDFPYGFSPMGKPHRHENWPSDEPWQQPADSWQSSGSQHSSGRRDGGGGGGAILAIIVAVAIILISWGISVLIRFALSRTREYLADAGAVELTKNPEAMVRALQKISRNAELDVPSRMEAFFIENPVKARIGGLFSTHPSMEHRIAALRRYGGAREEMSESSVPKIS